MRVLSKQFLEDLKFGSLSRLTKAVIHDETLSLEIRNNYINIYYRGGSLFRIESKKDYTLSFDKKYLNHGIDCGFEPLDLSKFRTVDDYVDGIAIFKREMDLWFSVHRKQEREYQQVISRENNFSIVSNDTDYFICDIEYAKNESIQENNQVTKTGSRFDMVGVKWLSNSLDRRNNKSVSLAIFELKYGDGAMTGSAGIMKHFKDLDDFMSKGKHVELMDEAETQFNQKYYLGLIEVTRSKKENEVEGMYKKIEINRNIKPEYILIFANHKSKSTKLLRELREAIKTYPHLLDKVDIKIAHSSMMGYGLYANHMIDIKDFMGF
ncbi:MAG: hypothetical protein Q8S15_06935 [Erysipelotrichaceae bacterium]|nr:hypothetical protein [Erysipelotrichaceae bacterium]